MKSKLFAVALALLFSACASSYKLPATKPISPESEGVQQFSFQTGPRQFYQTTLTTDNALVLVNDSPHMVETFVAFGLNGNYGLTPWLDAGINADTATCPIYYLKAQFLGKSRTSADEGNFSASVLFGVSGGISTTSSSSVSLFSSNSGTTDYKTNTGLYSALQFGYRTSKSVVLTAGIDGYWQSLDGSQTLTPSGTHITFSDKPRLLEINWGAIINPGIAKEDNKSFLQPLIQYGRLSTFGRNEYRFSYSLDIGYHF